MNLRLFLQATACAALALVFSGCATKPYDYTNYRQHPPRSILVLPPLNESTTDYRAHGCKPIPLTMVNPDTTNF